MKKGILVLAFVLAIMVSICACSSNEGISTPNSSTQVVENNQNESSSSVKPKVISIISTTDDVPLLEYVGKQYEKKYGIKLNIISQAYDNTHQKIITSFTGKTDIDLTYIDTVWPAEFASVGALIPLDKYITSDLKDDLIEATLNQMVYDGKTYGIPYSNNGKWMFYNKKMLSDGGYTEPPKTWDELERMSQNLIKKGIAKYGIAWAGKQAEGLVCDMTIMLHVYGGDWMDSNGKFVFNSEAGIKGLEMITNSIKDGWADPASISYDDRETLNPFMAGDAAFALNWSFAWSLANDKTQSKVANNVGICLIPGEGSVKSASVTGGGGIGIMSTSKNPDYAWKFIEMLVSPESQKYAVQNCSTLPTRKSIYTDKEMTNKCDFLALMYPQYEFAYPRPKIPNYSQWSNIIQSAISNVLTGQLDAKTALDKAVQDSNALLSQNK